ARPRRRDRVARAREARRPRGRVTCADALRPVGGSRGGGRVRRLAALRPGYPRGRRGEVPEGGVPVAKSSQRRRKRPQQHAGKKRAGGGGGGRRHNVAEQQMFFPRLRRQAKWMFIVLAVVFAVGFVGFAVASGPRGPGPLFSNRRSFALGGAA